MSGRARLTVCAAAASLMAACSLLPLATPNGWMAQALLFVALQSGVGALARRVPLARPLTVLAQALVSLLVLTVMFAPHQAMGGVIPGPSAFVQLSDLVRDGLTDVSQFAIPAPVTPGIRMLLVGGVLLVALAVDALAVTYNSAAPAGLPLLALYSVAAGLSNGGAQWLFFLIAASGYLLLLLAEGRDRLSRWGRVFGGGPPAHGWAGGSANPASGSRVLAPVRTGRRIGVMALGLALVAPAVLPSLGSGLLDTSGTGTGPGHGGTISAVNPVVALQDNLNQQDNREVLSYKTNSTDLTGMYLRIVALDEFDGTQWQPSKRKIEDIPPVLPQPAGMAPDVKYTKVETSVKVDDGYAQGWLPMPFPAQSVNAPGHWRFEPEGRTVIGDRGQNTSGISYTVTSMQVQPTAAQLAAAPHATGRIADEYTKVPHSLPKVVEQTARQVVTSAHANNDYEKALALQRYFTGGAFVYNTKAQSGTGVDAIARFLKTKEGFCIHFAFTMAAMARTLDIPARVAVGFTPGSPGTDGVMSVGLKDAHAWPELYFEGLGWTRFEPTPYRGSAPSYTQATAPAGTDEPADQGRHGTAATPTPTPTPSEGCGTDNRAAAACGSTAVTATGGSGGGGFGGGKLAGFTLLALLVLALPLTPLLWRTRQRSRRLGGGRGGTAEGLALSAWREVVDTGWDYGIAPDESETPRRAMARLVRDGELSGQAAASAGSLATAVERVLYAPHAEPQPTLAADVQHVRAGLRQSAGRRARLRALLLPRSAARLLWQFTDRWSAAGYRLSQAAQRFTGPLRKRMTRQA
ncbi:transglutaminase TgpA family protein [Actinacidiphila alni]|uniref:transglutaminase TgpA family protein n=1 Tax=Actinacidiphila alni TaxID=380248 RepID=UPI003455B7C4